jgi:hypothetical protein
MINQLLQSPTDFEVSRLVEICHENFTYKISKSELIYLINSKRHTKLYVARKELTIIAFFLVLDNDNYADGRLASYLAVSKSSRSIDTFIKFTRFVYDDLRREGVGFIYGVANINALELHKKIGGWKVAFNLDRVKLTVIDQMALETRANAIQTDELKFEFKFDTYSNWRYLEFSERKYIYITVCGVGVVAKIWKEADFTRLHLMQINWNEARVHLRKIINEIYYFAAKKSCDEIDFWAPPWVCNELGNMGYKFKRSEIEVIYKLLRGNKALEEDEVNSFGFGATDSF